MKRVMNAMSWAVAAMMLVSCSATPKNSSPSTTTAPGTLDELTVDRVMQNIDAYRGKQVRWLGSMVGSEVPLKSRKFRSTFVIGKVNMEEYLNLRVSGKGFQFFVAEFATDKSDSPSSTFSSGWISGTIDGTDTLALEVRSGVETNHKKVPLLVNATFEKDDSKH